MVCSTFFLYAYLSVFDWRLIWIIDYSDIFKVGLVALGVLSSIIIVLLTGMQMFLSVAKIIEVKAAKVRIWFVSIVCVTALAVVVFVEWGRSAVPYRVYIEWALLALTFCFVIARYVARIGRNPTLLTAPSILGLCSLFIVTAGIAGSTFGDVTKYSKSLRYDVFLKDREMADVRLVLFTSHHTVLYSGNQVIVLPTTDILKIVAHPADQE